MYRGGGGDSAGEGQAMSSTCTLVGCWNKANAYPSPPAAWPVLRACPALTRHAPLRKTKKLCVMRSTRRTLCAYLQQWWQLQMHMSQGQLSSSFICSVVGHTRTGTIREFLFTRFLVFTVTLAREGADHPKSQKARQRGKEVINPPASAACQALLCNYGRQCTDGLL